MKYMTTAEIREKYLKFFEEKGCKRMPSSSLIPDDPSLLLTSAGMVQFKPYFLHQKELDPQYIGTTTVQKCVRTNDIDNIGDARHLSFFEMLGNFSFGKYFKNEMCTWAYEFSTEVLGLPKEKLYFTVFEDDDETIEIWKSLGVEDSHISRLGEDDNFWRAGPTGPCGPCSEIYFDQGPEVGCGSPDCAPGCDCDRFLEYWNCVFTQFDGQEDGTLAPLPSKNIDTGMGLERIAAIMQGVTNNYDTDVLRSLIAVGERLSGKEYKTDADVDKSLRIISDHSRSVTFMIADGILPSNEGRGYVLRRLLRRAIQKRWSRTSGKLRAIRVNVISFGFKYGVPREADFVFDLRFLPNPYFVEKLRPLSGKDKAVRDYVFASEAAQEFEKKLFDLVRFMLPQMEAEGRYRVAIAVGCTGGRHRSVATAEALFQMLRQADYPASIEHRHLELG